MASVAKNTRTRTGSTAPQVNQNVVDDICDENKDVVEDGDGGVWETAGGKFKKVKPKKYSCRGGKKACGLTITDGEDSVCCDMCEEWYHPKCQGLTMDAFRALSSYDFLWLCSSCRPKFMGTLKTGKQIEAKLEDVEQKILGALESSRTEAKSTKQLEEKIASLEKMMMGKMNQQQVEVEKSLKVHEEVVQSMPELQSQLKKSTQELKKLVEKKEDKETREVNIIIHNIPESKSDDPATRKKYDSDSFYNIVQALGGDARGMEMDNIYRLGKKKEVVEGSKEKSKPRLMLVRLKKKEDVEMLISKRWELSKAGFSNIYLTRDLPLEERELQRKLREELAEKGKDTHRIFRGKVVPKH